MFLLFGSVMVYTSPIKELNFLEDHEQDVDFVLVSVHMKEMHGFQFLDMSREMHKNLQVISKSEIS
jgi:CheY-like chemotaxis protein